MKSAGSKLALALTIATAAAATPATASTSNVAAGHTLTMDASGQMLFAGMPLDNVLAGTYGSDYASMSELAATNCCFNNNCKCQIQHFV